MHLSAFYVLCHAMMLDPMLLLLVCRLSLSTESQDGDHKKERTKTRFEEPNFLTNDVILRDLSLTLLCPNPF